MKVLIVLFFFLTACGTGQKGTQLQELERMLQDPDAAVVNRAPGGKRIYQQANRYRRLSLDSWDAGKGAISEEYALLGWLKYRTAVAVYEKFKANERLEIAKAKIGGSQPEIKAMTEEELKLKSEIARLEDRVALLKGQKSQENDHSGTMVSSSGEVKSDRESLSAFNVELRRVEAARVTADKMDAKIHASTMYAKASNLYNSLKAELDRNNAISNDMQRRVKHALVYFQTAAKDAESGYLEQESKKDPVKRQRVLISDLSKSFGSDRVIVEVNSVRLILSSSFVSGDTSINSSLETLLDLLWPTVARFDDFSVNVEGFTEKGDATENLGISQVRAKVVRDYLLKKVNTSASIGYSGRGQDNLRFSTTIENNRVEIVFSR